MFYITAAKIKLFFENDKEKKSFLTATPLGAPTPYLCT